jgi:hypothetical protein
VHTTTRGSLKGVPTFEARLQFRECCMAYLSKIWTIGIVLCTSLTPPSLNAKDELSLELIGGSKDYPIARYKSETSEGRITYGIWEFYCPKEQFRNLRRGYTEAMLELRLPDTQMQDTLKGTVERTGMAVICNLSKRAWAAKVPGQGTGDDL